MKINHGNNCWNVWSGFSWDAFKNYKRAKWFSDFCKETYTESEKDIPIGFISFGIKYEGPFFSEETYYESPSGKVETKLDLGEDND